MMQIGEAAERAGLSVRTIRHYEEIGLITPSARSDGGFRLYTDADLARLAVVKRMKPLGFTLEEMGDLLRVLDALESGSVGPALRDRLAMFHEAALARVQALREQLETAEGFAAQIAAQMSAHARDMSRAPGAPDRPGTP